MFFTNMAITVALMAVAAAIEAFLPLFGRGQSSEGRTRANLSLTAVVFGFNWVLTSITAVVALKLKPAGILAMFPVPFAVQVVMTVVVLDFMYGWASHVLLHKIPFLWRAHSVHHSDPFVDVTTSFRTHPIETLWRFLFMTIPAWTLGLPATGIVIYRLLGTINGVFEHANIRVWRPLDRIGSFLWVTPNMHKIHHSDEQSETDSNYGNILSVYDRAFGTFTHTDRAHHVVYGLKDDPVETRSFVGLLTHPFSTAETREQRDVETVEYVTKGAGRHTSD
jgi:sterol desaturase/sphingolipid hydroxylase (fatty acid hydroxylase superfamily)